MEITDKIRKIMIPGLITIFKALDATTFGKVVKVSMEPRGQDGGYFDNKFTLESDIRGTRFTKANELREALDAAQALITHAQDFLGDNYDEKKHGSAVQDALRQIDEIETKCKKTATDDKSRAPKP